MSQFATVKDAGLPEYRQRAHKLLFSSQSYLLKWEGGATIKTKPVLLFFIFLALIFWVVISCL